ncbi:MAG: amidase family protein, partial [Pseudomonadota bacterium]
MTDALGPEATIAILHPHLAADRLGVEALVRTQLQRIAAPDGAGGSGALVLVAPNPLEADRQRDAARRRGEGLLPLDGVTVIVKDNIGTAGLQTTAGSLALAGHGPTADAPLVARL